MACLRPIFVCLLLTAIIPSTLSQIIPRITFPIGSPGRSFDLLTLPDVHNTTTLLLSNDEETFYVGAKNALLSVNISQEGTLLLNKKLDWSPSEKEITDCTWKGQKKMDCQNFVRVLQVLNSTHMYACGTFAFSPQCTLVNSTEFSLVKGPSRKYEEGRGRSPFNPYQKNTAITVDGELYTGTVLNYWGSQPAISRHLSNGDHIDLRLDDTLGWLEDPTFISSAYMPSEKKVYFFFSEIGREYNFVDKFTVSRVAQVCTSDIGGKRVLQRRWTTFTKAQLLCKVKGELPYNVLQDMDTLWPAESTNEDNVLFYGIFRQQWSVNSGRSAVCVYSLKSIKDVFAGHYRVLNRGTMKWSTSEQAMIVNPGECGLHNSSDKALQFVRSNFLAESDVLPVSPGLAIESPDQRYSNIAAQRVKGAHGKEYTVLHLLTESGYLHKAVLLKKGAHIVEEIQVFKQPQLVKNLLLSVSKGVVLVGFSEGVASISVSNCSHYSGCAECVLARDPFCGWDPTQKICTNVSSIGDQVVQDVEEANVNKACKPIAITTPTTHSDQQESPTDWCSSGEPVPVSLNEVVRLRCPAASRLARTHWERQNSQLSPKVYMQQDDSTLSFLATPSTLGCYACLAAENDFTQTLVAYQVKQEESTREKPDLEPKVAAHVQQEESENSLLQAARPSYLKELVVMSVLFAVLLSGLLSVALYCYWQRSRTKTAPHAPGSLQDVEQGHWKGLRRWSPPGEGCHPERNETDKPRAGDSPSHEAIACFAASVSTYPTYPSIHPS